jgi:hypothetical protein
VPSAPTMPPRPPGAIHAMKQDRLEVASKEG